MNNLDSKIRARLDKLLKLAEQGRGGEKVNAEKRLNGLLKKHGLTISDLDDEATEMVWFKYKVGKHHNRLMRQIIYAVVGPGYETWKNSYRRYQIGSEVTASQRIEIELKYAAYAKGIDEEYALFMSAFHNKHDIFPTNAPEAEDRNYTPEELARIEKMCAMAENMSDISVHQQIKG